MYLWIVKMPYLSWQVFLWTNCKQNIFKGIQIVDDIFYYLKTYIFKSWVTRICEQCFKTDKTLSLKYTILTQRLFTNCSVVNIISRPKSWKNRAKLYWKTKSSAYFLPASTLWDRLWTHHSTVHDGNMWFVCKIGGIAILQIVCKMGNWSADVFAECTPHIPGGMFG